jgi:hypothetical protein
MSEFNAVASKAADLVRMFIASDGGAYNLFQILHGNPGLLDEAMVRQRLFEAAEKCGLVADDGADAACVPSTAEPPELSHSRVFGRWHDLRRRS